MNALNKPVNSKTSNSKFLSKFKWSHPTWIDIPEFLKFIFSCSRGEQHRYCRDVVLDYQNDWFDIVLHNTGKAVNKLLNLFKQLNVQHDFSRVSREIRDHKFSREAKDKNMYAQSLEDLYTLPATLRKTCGMFQEAATNVTNLARTAVETNLTDNLNSALNGVSELTGRLNSLTSTFEGVLASTLIKFQQKMDSLKWSFSIVGEWLPVVVLFLAKIVSMATLLSIPENFNFKCVAAIVTLALPSSVGGNLEFISSLIRAIKGVIGNMSAQGENDDSFIKSFYFLTKDVMRGVFSSVDKDTYTDMNISSKKVKIVTDYIRSASTLIEFFMKLVEKLMEILGNQILKHYGVMPWFLKEDILSPLINRFLEIKEKRLDHLSGTNRHAAQKINDLYQEVLKYEASIVKNKAVLKEISFRVMPYLRIMARSLEQIVSRIPPHLLDGKDMRRSKPFWIYIWGMSRIGKSAMLQPYLINLLAKALDIREEYEDYTNYTYFRNCGEEYWEKYKNHPFLWYNDLFQNFSDEEAMQKAIVELTNVVDDSMYALNMAFEEKHGVYFNSNVVISNAQEDIIGKGFISSKCLSQGEHLYARRNIVLEFCLNKIYLNKNGTGIDYEVMNRAMEIEPCIGTVKKLFPKNMYVLKFHDPVTGNLIKEMDFEKGVQYVVDQAKLYAQSQDMFKDRLYDHFKTMWTQSGEQRLILCRYCGEYFCEKDFQTHFSTHDQIFAQCNGVTITICDSCGNNVALSDYKKHKLTCYHVAQCGDDVACSGSCDSMASKDFMGISCSHCNLEVDIDDYPEHLQKCRAEHLFCDRCSRWFKRKSFREHIDLCFMEKISPMVQSEWFDACDAVEPDMLLQHFHTAVQKIAPELIDNPLIQIVDQAHFNKNTHVMQALSTYYIMDGDLLDEQIAKIQIIIEIAGASSWANFIEERENRTIWLRIKNGMSKYWTNFKNYAVKLFMTYPVLFAIISTCTYYVVFLTVFTWIESLMRPTQTFNSQTGEGSKKVQAKQIERRHKEKQKLSAQSYDEQNIVVENKLRDHMCKFVVTVRDLSNETDIDTRYFGTGLCVGSDVFVLPRHFWVRWIEIKEFYESKGHRVVLKLMWDENKIVEVPWDTITHWEPDYEHLEDLVFLRITKLVQLSHIGKFFASVGDEPVLFESYLYGLRMHDFKFSSISVSNAEYATSVSYAHEARVEPIYNHRLEERQIHVPLCFKYMNCHTVGGDCGLMLLHTDSKQNCRKILGMHTAGNTRTGFGVSSAIFQEDIEEAFKELYKEDVAIQVEQLTLVDCDKVMSQSEEYTNLAKTGVTIIGAKYEVCNKDFGIKKKFKITLPRKSKINKSVVYDAMCEDYGPSTVAPARLKPFIVNDEVISPLYLGLKKIPRCSNMVSKKECDIVCQHMLDSMKSWVSPYTEMRVLTNFETINGYGLLKPLDMTTSAGFPYTVVDNTSGKHPYFNIIKESPKQYEMKSFLRSQFDEREYKAQNGIVMETFFLDTLKDEVRDLDKVEIGKTRIFQIAPVDFNMLMRKYFGTFISFCHSIYLEGEMAIGINANSGEWTYMIRQLLGNSKSFINGDGKNFDASIGQQYMMEVVEVVNEFYNDGKQNALVRRVIFATFLNSRHIVGNIVYMSRQGNKSGIALTTIFNNLAGMFAIRLAFYRQYQSLYGFSKYIVAKFYGDDDLISVKENCLVDSLVYQKIWLELGVEYTAADKTDFLLPFYKIDSISFLQRSFVYEDQYRMYLPQLCYQTILEIARWSESDPYNMMDQMNRFNSSLMEMSNYSREQFKQLRKNFCDYIGVLNNLGFVIKTKDLFTYEYAKQLIFPEIYNQKFLNNTQRDLLARIDKCEQLLLGGGGGSE